MPDIDIDFADRTVALEHFKHVTATIEDNSTFKKHNSGIYCTSIPHNPITGLSTIDYKTAEDRGYFKIDFLNVGVYNGVQSEEHLKRLMETEPLWELLEQDDFTNLLFHVNGHGHILRKMKPKNIEQLSAVLEIKRPAKKHQLGKSWDEVLEEVWLKPTTEEYYFKKSHATAYAAAIVVQMNLICEGVN